MDLLKKYQEIIRAHQLQNKKLVLAVSGGLDSVVLVHLSYLARLNFVIAHCNFQLRGEESRRDEEFVRLLGKKYERSFYLKTFDAAAVADEKKCSVQEAARELRYQWFGQLEKELSAQNTLLAHHADDNIETVLMNFFRGTGLKGLTGIPETNVSSVHILRPFLHFRRKDLFNYATDNNLEWVEDSSNASSDYTRNFFRNELIPAIKKAFPAVEENLLGNIYRFRGIDVIYNAAVGKLSEKIVDAKEGEIRLPVKKLLGYAATSIPWEIFRKYGFNEAQVEEIMKLTSAQTGKYVANEKWQVIRHRAILVVAPRSAEADMVLIDENTSEVVYPGGRLAISRVSASEHKLSSDPSIAQLDLSQISFPLVLRKWKEGDYFYPLGLRKKKKIARFFIDQKLSKADKEKAWVLESGQRIAWIVGQRIDDRCKITAATRNVLVICKLDPQV